MCCNTDPAPDNLSVQESTGLLLAYSLTRGLAPNCDFPGIASEKVNLYGDQRIRGHTTMAQKNERISVSTGKQLVDRLIPRTDMKACFV